MAGTSQNVPKEYVRAADHHLLPPRVGHNWNDQAFRQVQNRPQQLEGELRGRRAFVSSGTPAGAAAAGGTASTTGGSAGGPPAFGESAQQLILALSAKNPRRVGNGNSVSQKRYLSLDDKVLRFYAYLRERAPEGGANKYWHRRMVVHFYPEDDTVLVQEPYVANSGLDGGTFLKRQRVPADPRQRELYPDDEYLTLNFFNVGASVRILGHDFHLYDCDDFTRRFLTTLGVEVGAPEECPDDALTATGSFLPQRQQQSRPQDWTRGGTYGGVCSEAEKAAEAEAVRAARFQRDGGVILHFKGVLDERATGGLARRLEVFLYIEDNSIAITEQPTIAEATPALFLSRCFLPKSGSLARTNELTFSHRVNGQREPEVGPEGIYRDIDLDVGVTLNVLGRPVLLYDCDDFTRAFYEQRYGIALRPPMTAEVDVAYGGATAASSTRAGRRAAGVDGGATNRSSGRAATTASAAAAASRRELRFRLVPAHPMDHTDGLRRFTLTYYTDTNEVTVYETSVNGRGGGGGRATCLLRRQPLRRSQAPRGPRNDPSAQQQQHLSMMRGDDAAAAADVYTAEDFRVGRELVVCGVPMRISAMDAHTEAYFTGAPSAPPSAAAVNSLLAELREFLGSRYGTAVRAFLALDRDRDGRIGLDEFLASLAAFQMTEDASLGTALFVHIAGSSSTVAASHEGGERNEVTIKDSIVEPLTPNDLMRWMGEPAVVNITPNARGCGMRETTPSTIETGNYTSDSLTTSDAAAAATARASQRATLAASGMRRRVLSEMRERLEARRMHGGDMFRLASTMPRAYRQGRADLHTLSNPDRDALITPVQVRRCCEEILGATLGKDEMACVVSFFFPSMPADEQFRPRDDVLDYTVDLPTFQRRYDDMCRLAMLPESMPATAAPTAMKTSIL